MSPGPPTISDSAGASRSVPASSLPTLLPPRGSLASKGMCATDSAVVATAAVSVAAVAAAADTSGRPAAVALTERGTPT